MDWGGEYKEVKCIQIGESKKYIYRVLGLPLQSGATRLWLPVQGTRVQFLARKLDSICCI